jgi:peroxiredoxin
MKRFQKYVSRLFFPIIIIVSACTTNGDNGNVKISGTISNVSGSNIVLEALHPTQTIPVDSAIVGSDGSFDLTANVAEPGFYRLKIANGQFIHIILQPKDDITIKADANTFSGNYEISGSPQSEALRKLNTNVQISQQSVNQLEQQFAEARNNNHPDLEGLQKSLQAEYLQLMAQREKDVMAFIDTNSGNLSQLAALGYLQEDDHFETYKKVSDDLYSKYPNSQYVVDLNNKVKEMAKIAIGSEAPDIAMKNPEGETISLSSLRGKYVLIDFWAAWCGPCRAENPHLVNVYNKYKDKNFEIFGVSLDANRDSWIKAIKDDKLPWPQVSDLQRWNSPVVKMYNISGIPFSVLLDPQGKIIAKGLRSAALDQQLSLIFK